MAVVSFREPIEGLSEVLDVLKPEVVQVIYENYDDLLGKIAAVRKQHSCQAE